MINMNTKTFILIHKTKNLGDVYMETTSRMIEYYDDKRIKEKYNRKFERYKNYILKKFDDLKDAEKYVFYYSDGFLRKLSNLSNDIKDSLKGSCDTEKKMIYISDWILEKGGKELVKVTLHELLHLNFPNKTEKEIIIETEKRFSQINNDVLATLYFAQ